MNRRTLLGSVAALSIAGCTDLTSSETRLDAEVVTDNSSRYIEFREETSSVADVSVSPTETAEDNRYVFDLLPHLEDDLQWTSLHVAFSFPTLNPEWPQIYLRADRSITNATIDRNRDGTTEFSLTEEASQYPSPHFEAHPQHDDYESLEMEMEVTVTAVDNGFSETTYTGSGTISVELI